MKCGGIWKILQSTRWHWHSVVPIVCPRSHHHVIVVLIWMVLLFVVMLFGGRFTLWIYKVKKKKVYILSIFSSCVYFLKFYVNDFKEIPIWCYATSNKLTDLYDVPDQIFPPKYSFFFFRFSFATYCCGSSWCVPEKNIYFRWTKPILLMI